MSSTTPVSTDSSSLLARLHPSHYLSTHLSHSSRPSSSRSPLDFPDVDLNLGPIASSSSSNRPEWLPSPSALARIGPTTVICNITPSIVYPPQMSTPSSSQAGSTVVPSINLTPLSSPSADFKSGAPSNFAQCTTERLYEFLDSSLPFEPEVLHIPTEGGEAAGAGVEEAKRGPPRAKWCLFADCTVVGYDGALLETAMLAITAALRQLWLPKSVFSLDENVVIASPSDYWSLSTHMDSLPLAFFFAIYDEKLLACPSSFEADLAQSSMAMCLSAEKAKERKASRSGKREDTGDGWSLCAMHSTGPLRATNVALSPGKGKPLDDEELIARCLALASARAGQIAATLRAKEADVESVMQKARGTQQ